MILSFTWNLIDYSRKPSFCQIDIDEHRLQIAKDFNAADFTYQSDRNDTNAEELATKLRGISKSAPHAAFECCGADIALVAGVHVSNFTSTF